MATTIKLKNSVTTTNAPSSLVQGEVAINITDKKVWVGNAATTPIQLLGAGSSASFGALTCTSLTNSGLTSGRVTYATTAGLLTDSANLTFNGTTLTANTIGAFTLGGTISGGGNQINNIVIGASTPLAGSFTTLSASGVATFSAGTVSAPALTTTGDTNTGIFFPAADTIAFAEGGAEAMRIDSSGNVGIDTSSPAYRLQVRRSGGAGSLGVTINNTVGFTRDVQYYSVADSTSDTTGHAFYVRNGSATDNLAMRIASDGNVGIGTSSPAAVLNCVNASYDGYGQILLSDGATNSTTKRSGINQAHYTNSEEPFTIIGGASTSTDNIVRIGGNDATATLNASTRIVFYTATNNTTTASSASERMRITSGGDLLVGTTSTASSSVGFRTVVNAGYVSTTTSGNYNICNTANATGTETLIQFQYSNVAKGGISCDGTTIAYNTTSDYRLKENIAPMTGALSKIAQLKPCTYTWKVDGSDGQGFIAHELQKVFPDAVVGEKDAVDEKGNIKPQGVDTSFLVATLTAAIQELKAELDSVKAELNQLKGA